MALAALLLVVAGYVGYHIGIRSNNLPNSWVGANKQGAYLFSWTESGSNLSGTEESGGGCADSNPVAISGVASDGAITLHFSYPATPSFDATVVGSVNAHNLSLPGWPLFHPGSLSAFNRLVASTPQLTLNQCVKS